MYFSGDMDRAINVVGNRTTRNGCKMTSSKICLFNFRTDFMNKNACCQTTREIWFQNPIFQRSRKTCGPEGSWSCGWPLDICGFICTHTIMYRHSKPTIRHVSAQLETGQQWNVRSLDKCNLIKWMWTFLSNVFFVKTDTLYVSYFHRIRPSLK